MPHACSYEVPADEQFYRQVLAEIDDEHPQGMLLHLVVKSDVGLHHTIVWESEEGWRRFRDERVRPAVEKLLTAAGVPQLPPPPVEKELQVVDLVTAS